MTATFQDCWTYPKAKIDEFMKDINERLEALEEAQETNAGEEGDE